MKVVKKTWERTNTWHFVTQTHLHTKRYQLWRSRKCCGDRFDVRAIAICDPYHDFERLIANQRKHGGVAELQQVRQNQGHINVHRLFSRQAADRHCESVKQHFCRMRLLHLCRRFVGCHARAAKQHLWFKLWNVLFRIGGTAWRQRNHQHWNGLKRTRLFSTIRVS